MRILRHLIACRAKIYDSALARTGAARHRQAHPRIGHFTCTRRRQARGRGVYASTDSQHANKANVRWTFAEARPLKPCPCCTRCWETSGQARWRCRGRACPPHRSKLQPSARLCSRAQHIFLHPHQTPRVRARTAARGNGLPFPLAMLLHLMSQCAQKGPLSHARTSSFSLTQMMHDVHIAFPTPIRQAT